MSELVEEIDSARRRVLVVVLVGFAVGLAVPWLAPFVWLAAIWPAVRWARASWRLGGELALRARFPLEDLRDVPSARR